MKSYHILNIRWPLNSLCNIHRRTYTTFKVSSNSFRTIVLINNISINNVSNKTVTNLLLHSNDTTSILITTFNRLNNLVMSPNYAAMRKEANAGNVSALDLSPT